MDNQCHGKRIDEIVDELKTHIEKGLGSQEANDCLRMRMVPMNSPKSPDRDSSSGTDEFSPIRGMGMRSSS